MRETRTISLCGLPLALLALWVDASAPQPVRADPKQRATYALTQTIPRPVGRAPSFRDALLRHGASKAEADSLIEALQGIVDFRHAQPQDQLLFWRDKHATLQAFEYRALSQGSFRVERDTRGVLRGSRVDTAELRRVAKGTVVSGSLVQSLAEIGLGGTLPSVIERALASKLAIGKDARKGDTVKVIVDAEYAKRRLVRIQTVHAIEYVSERAGKLQAFWFECEPGHGEFYDSRGRALSGSWMRTPVRHEAISSGFNLRRRHPILKRIVPHLGVDYAADRGTPVWAAADGEVTFAGRLGANGNLVSLRHDSGYESHYAHLSKFGPGIRRGRKIRQRQVLGYVGSTGRSTGPHLHFGLKRDGRFINPIPWLDGPGAPLPSKHRARFRAELKRLRAQLARIAVHRHAATIVSRRRSR